MPVVTVRQIDLLAAVSATLAAAMAGVYIAVIDQQGGDPLVWVPVVLLAGAAAAGCATWTRAPHRRALLLIAGVALTGLGLLAILSIGLPIIAAGILALVAGARTGTPPTVAS